MDNDLTGGILVPVMTDRKGERAKEGRRRNSPKPQRGQTDNKEIQNRTTAVLKQKASDLFMKLVLKVRLINS